MKNVLILLSTFIYAGAYPQSGADSILRQAAKNMKMLRSVNYTIFDESGGRKISAEVTVKKAMAIGVFDIAQVKLKGMAVSEQGALSIAFAYDGNKFEFLDPKSGDMVRIDSPSINKVGRTGMLEYGLLVLGCYTQAEPMENVFKHMESVEDLGDTTVYGISTVKLKVVMHFNDAMGDRVTEVFWYIGKADGLVRGISSRYARDFIKIKTINTELNDSDFSLTGPGILKTITGMEPMSDGLLKPGTTAPGWTLASNTGRNIQLSELKGKVVLLDFWGTWCMPCIKAMPDIQAVYDHFKGQPVEVIGVSVELEKKVDPLAFVKAKGFTYPIVLNGVSITKDYRVQIFPSVYIIDKKGNIIHAEHSGSREDFRQDIISRIEKALRQ